MRNFSDIHIYYWLYQQTIRFPLVSFDEETKQNDRKKKEIYATKLYVYTWKILVSQSGWMKERLCKQMRIVRMANGFMWSFSILNKNNFCLSPFEISHELCAISFNTSQFLTLSKHAIFMDSFAFFAFLFHWNFFFSYYYVFHTFNGRVCKFYRFELTKLWLFCSTYNTAHTHLTGSDNIVLLYVLHKFLIISRFHLMKQINCLFVVYFWLQFSLALRYSENSPKAINTKASWKMCCRS